MDQRFVNLRKRISGSEINDDYTLKKEREKSCRLGRSIFNGSVMFYPIIILIVVVCWILIAKGVIV